MSTQKTATPNYDAETVAWMIETYTAAGDELSPEGEAARDAAVDAIQKKTGKSLHSIRSKLGAEKVYIPKAKPVKVGKRETKSDLIDKIVAADPSKPEGFFDSLEGANKGVLNYVMDLQAELLTFAAEADEVSE